MALLTRTEKAVLAQMFAGDSPRLTDERLAALDRLVAPIQEASAAWDHSPSVSARNTVLAEVHRRQAAYWGWDDAVWLGLTGTRQTTANRNARLHLVALAYRLGGHRRLHRRAGVTRVPVLARLVFGVGDVDAALAEVRDALRSWGTGPSTLEHQIGCALCDLMLACRTTDLTQISGTQLTELVAEYPRGQRRNGLIKISRVLAHKGIIATPIKGNERLRGSWRQTLDSVPEPWLDWAQRWRRLAIHEPATVRTMFAGILIAGRWAAERHPDAVSPDRWTREIAAEYVADTVQAVGGQWAPNNRNRSGWGKPLSAAAKAGRMDALRGFFADLIEWEWITARFVPVPPAEHVGGDAPRPPGPVQPGVRPGRPAQHPPRWAR